MRKKFAGIVGMVIVLLLSIRTGALAKSARDIVIKYAQEIYDFKWTATSPILLHNTNTWIPAGEIRGVQYTLYWSQNTFNEYKQLIKDSEAGEDNGLYDTATYSIEWDKNGNPITWRTSMKYGMACATFVTDCIKQGFSPYNINLPKKTQTYFHNDGDIWKNYITVGDTTNEAYAELQKGDYLDNYNHVILVTGNDGKTIS